MLERPAIVDSKARPAAVIRLDIPQSDIASVLPPAISELTETLAGQGLHPDGPLFAHYFRFDGGRFELEVGFPIAGPLEPRGRVVQGELPKARVVRAIHRGHYETLRSSWAELEQWIKAEGHLTGHDLWECYLAGPGSGVPPSEWRTELNRPLLS